MGVSAEDTVTAKYSRIISAFQRVSLTLFSLSVPWNKILSLFPVYVSKFCFSSFIFPLHPFWKMHFFFYGRGWAHSGFQGICCYSAELPLWDRAVRKGRNELCCSQACETRPSSTEQSRGFFYYQKSAPCLIEISAKGWEGRNETPWTVAKPTIQFVPLPPEEQQ